MLQIVKSNSRYKAEHGWLTSFHHFSFADYHDPDNQGWGALRVFNDDFIAPGGKFGMHPHANYEIITIVVSGAITHVDSMGNKERIGENQVQAMTAGSGITHSEENEGGEMLHSYQVWLRPKKTGANPSYKTATFNAKEFQNRLCPLVSGNGKAPLQILQDAQIFRCRLQKGKTAGHEFENECGYLFAISGKLIADGIGIQGSDSAKIKGEKKIKITASEDCDFLLFDLPK